MLITSMHYIVVIGLKNIFSLVLLSKNYRNIINIRVIFMIIKQYFLLIINVILILIMFPYFLDNITNKFALVMKKSTLSFIYILKIDISFFSKIIILFTLLFSTGIIKTIIFINIIKYLILIAKAKNIINFSS